MSHELRTPLNSILILGQQLADNPDGNLKPKQVEFARTIHGAGTDLLNLISDILDLSKIESGTVTVDAEEIFFTNVLETVARPFRHQAESQGLSFDVQVDANLGAQPGHRFQAPAADPEEPAVQRAEVHRPGQRAAARRCRCRPAGAPDNMALNQASSVVAFEVTDTGVGIPVEKQKIVFEAFQQADASHQPQVRRHGPRPRHQPRAGAAAGRRAHPAQHAGHGHDLHPLPADHVHRPAHRGARSRCRAPRRCRRSRCPSIWPTSSPTTATTCSPASRRC